MQESLAPEEEGSSVSGETEYLPSGGSPGGFDDVKMRLSQLSERIAAVESSLEALRRDLSAIEDEWRSEGLGASGGDVVTDER